MTSAEQEKFYKNLGARIKLARTNAGLKQETLAGLLKLSRVSVVNIEKGRQHTPTHVLWDLSVILKIDFIQLLYGLSPSTNDGSELQKRIVKQSDLGRQSKEKIFEFIEEVRIQNSTSNE